MPNDVPILPAYDTELASSIVAAPPRKVGFGPDELAAFQEEILQFAGGVRRELEDEGLIVEDDFAVADDGHRVRIHHVRRPDARDGRPCIFYVHGGGMVLGSPWEGAREFSQWIRDFDVSVATVDYRLAPHVTAPTLVEDCYAGLVHVERNAMLWGIDPASIVIAGMSAGGGLAAGTALLARDREGPRLLGQLLMAPMLDPDGDGDSVRQTPDGPWSRAENRAAWDLVLAGVPAEEVGHNAPARASSLANLPPTLLEVGSAELFRSETIAYAEHIWRTGGNAELHVWSGGFHGFGSFPHSAIAQGAIESRRNWLSRLLGYGPLEADQDEGSASAPRARR